jgi:hypothetical protein
MKQTNIRPQYGEDELFNERNDMKGFANRRMEYKY